MPRKQSARHFFSVFQDLGSKLRGGLHGSGRRGRSLGRPLGFESLEGRAMLSAGPGASILGTAYNDLTGNGLTADDMLLSGVTINLYRDGGNGTFQGSAAGSDDTLVGTQLTGATGKYEFDNLTAGTYFAQEVIPQGYTSLPAGSSVVKVVISSAAAQGTPGLTVDSFTSSQTADASSIGVTTATSSITAPEAIGGHRDLYAHLTSAVGDVNLSVSPYGEDVLEFNTSATGTGNRTVIWDGSGGPTPPSVNATGLNHVDLTNGGQSLGIATTIGSDHTGTLVFTIYKDANDWSTASVAIPNTGGSATQTVYIPFTSFTIGSGTGAGDFTDVGAIKLDVQAGEAANGQITHINTLGATPFVTNFASYHTASIGDFVFWDMNRSGIQSPADQGVPNATVQLLQNGSVIATTTTNAQGLYSFTGLAPGNYSLKFIVPNGAAFTLAHQGSDPAKDSDPDSTGATGTFALASGQADMTHDAGLVPIDLAITKAVNNPTPTVGSNVTFTITLTNAAGYSTATGVKVTDLLPAGLSFVAATPGAGTSYNSTTGIWNVGNLPAGSSATLTVTANVTNGGTKTNVATVTSADEPDVGTQLQANASVTPPGSIGDFVFWDMNKTGIQGPADQGVPNVTVQLLQNGSIISTTTTNSQGLYSFNGVAPGNYSLKFIAPNGAAFTLAHQGSDTTKDSDPDSTGATGTFSLASGQADMSHDAGLLPIDLAITKAVNNPTPTVGSNVTFTITLTNAAGYSTATGVKVTDLLPAGLTFVSATSGAGTSYDSGTGIWNVGNLPAGGSATLTMTATVASGGTKTNVATVTSADEPDVGTQLQANASVIPPGSIGDFVFWDMNKDGLQSAGDAGVPNVTVQLLQNGSVISSTTTNSQGLYSFNGVAPGTYSLKFIAPNGDVFTLSHQGTDPAKDSDPDSTGATGTFSLASGQSDTTHDAGIVPIDLSIAKSVDIPTPKLGTNVTFTITVSNAAGYSTATGVTVSDPLPAGLTFVSASPGAGTYNSGTGMWNVGTLAGGASATLTLTATVPTQGTKTNVATITAADEPDVGTVLQASASVTPPPPVTANPPVIDLDITKTVDNPTPAVGSNVTFTITVSNAVGFDTATGITVSDVLPTGLAFVSANAAAGSSYNSGTGVWSIGSLASGASTTLTIVAHVTSTGTKTNIAQVTGADERDVNPDPEASASVTPPTVLTKRLFMSYKNS